MTKQRFPQRLAAAVGGGLLPLAALVFAGCGGGVGDVSGTVTYQGKPVVCGSVVLVGADGVPHTGGIKPDGTYSVSAVPAGVARVMVISPDPGPPFHPGDPSSKELIDRTGREENTPVPEIDRTKWRQLPKEYQDANTSGLTFTIAKGPNLHDILLP